MSKLFNIKGNDYRLVALIKFKIKMVYIRFIGTHKDYDNEHYPIGVPSLIDVLRLRMYEMNLTQKAMAELIGISASRLNEILTGKREPTLQVARAICINLSIDANIVLGVC